MESISKVNIGPLMAYLVPGATALWGLTPFVPALKNWFAATSNTTPTIGGFLYLTLAAFAAGMTVSAVRWLLVDTLHALMGLKGPAFNFARLGKNVTAFALLNHFHYQHYLFYANMSVASALAYGGFRLSEGDLLTLRWLDGGFLLVEFVFLATSRNTLQNYYRRGEQLLAASRQSKGIRRT